jgi:hypothetical protein
MSTLISSPKVSECMKCTDRVGSKLELVFAPTFDVENNKRQLSSGITNSHSETLYFFMLISKNLLVLPLVTRDIETEE